MSELISRQKLIEELTDVIIKHTCKPSGCQDCLCAFEYGIVEESCEEYLEYHKLAEKIYNEFVINITNQQPPADQWIPCSERPPEEPCFYTVEDRSPYTLERHGKPRRKVVTVKPYMWDVYDHVVAWKPIDMEPYKGVE